MYIFPSYRTPTVAHAVGESALSTNHPPPTPTRVPTAKEAEIAEHLRQLEIARSQAKSCSTNQRGTAPTTRSMRIVRQATDRELAEIRGGKDEPMRLGFLRN